MRKLIGTALAIGIALTTVSSAQAREGCGPGGHRNGWGDCRPNRGHGPRGGYVAVGPRGGLVVGRFYEGRGYWDGRRYWQNRYRHHGGWRYR